MRPFMSKLKAKKKPEHKTAVEGEAPRQRLDRPSRMRRADGGPTISKDSKNEVGRLRKETDAYIAKDFGKAAAAGALGTLAASAFGKRVGTPLSRIEKGIVGGATGATVLAAPKEGDAEVLKKRAEISRIERGEAEPGKEDRKKGGRVCK